MLAALILNLENLEPTGIEQQHDWAERNKRRRKIEEEEMMIIIEIFMQVKHELN